jgi:hypothetical protein
MVVIQGDTWSVHGNDGKFQPIAESFSTNKYNNLELFDDLIHFSEKVILE